MSKRSRQIRAERREKQARKWCEKENGPRGRAPEPLIDSAAERNLEAVRASHTWRSGSRDI